MPRDTRQRNAQMPKGYKAVTPTCPRDTKQRNAQMPKGHEPTCPNTRVSSHTSGRLKRSNIGRKSTRQLFTYRMATRQLAYPTDSNQLSRTQKSLKEQNIGPKRGTRESKSHYPTRLRKLHNVVLYPRGTVVVKTVIGVVWWGGGLV